MHNPVHSAYLGRVCSRETRLCASIQVTEVSLAINVRAWRDPYDVETNAPASVRRGSGELSMGLGVCGFCPGHTFELGFSSGLENPLQNIYGVHPLGQGPQKKSVTQILVPEPLHLPYSWNRTD